jgi:hypothetical protein
MDLVVREMSQITVPKDVLKQIDMRSLIEGLKTDYDKLDNLKVARQKHEDRNPFSRWWNSDEFEGAQLDAAELQASFSKKLGQLMVISIEQSKLLTQQQHSIQEQQNKIKKQATDLASANVQLDEQQQEQMQQQHKLEGLINDYFELKGLTAKDAEKLILIANEVKEMKSTIFDKLDLEVTAITEIKNNLLVSFEQEILTFNHKLVKFETELQNQLNNTSAKFSEKFTTIQKSFDESFEHVNADVAKNYEISSKASEQTNSNLERLEIDTQDKYQEVSERLITQQRTIEQTHSTLTNLEAVTESKHQDIKSELLNNQNEITMKIEQLDVQYKLKFSEQESLISLDQKQQQITLVQKNKQIKRLTIGLATSVLIGTTSLVIVLYPYFTR